eukprot:3541780-Rhodomonas_salina.1
MQNKLDELESEIGLFLKNKVQSVKASTPAPSVSAHSVATPSPPPLPAPEVVRIRETSKALIAALQGQGAEVDSSPIQWKGWTSLPLHTSRFGTRHHIRILIDSGAHGLFMSSRLAHRLGTKLNPLTAGPAARLPNGTLVPMNHETDPVTLCVDKHYKADLRFKTLPLE